MNTNPGRGEKKWRENGPGGGKKVWAKLPAGHAASRRRILSRGARLQCCQSALPPPTVWRRSHMLHVRESRAFKREFVAATDLRLYPRSVLMTRSLAIFITVSFTLMRSCRVELVLKFYQVWDMTMMMKWCLNYGFSCGGRGGGPEMSFEGRFCSRSASSDFCFFC